MRKGKLLSPNKIEHRLNGKQMLDFMWVKFYHSVGLAVPQTTITLLHVVHQGVPISHSVIFFLWAFVKDRVFVPPLPHNLDEIKEHIRRAVASVDAAMLHRIWNKIDYGLDVCRVTHRSHVEHFSCLHGSVVEVLNCCCSMYELCRWFESYWLQWAQRRLKLIVSRARSMGKQMVRCCCRQFSAGRQNVHDEERSGRTTIITDDLVQQRTMCLPIDLAQLTIKFNRRYALCIQKLYHWRTSRGGSWNRNVHLQAMQRSY
ncbi:hypothetical protein ANN_21933 [Periplaneta americana]|uniref:Uncharacterized protein n=1 Tax=Periplaneta americana TaxID=6978 RepID=A0ABQ8S6Q9_PERAM|nr:hypothetical protein ANN_21933 [Periplaneta americana]